MNFFIIAPYGHRRMDTPVAYSIARIVRRLAIVLLAAGSHLAHSQIDLNTNGVSDIWEASHGTDLDHGIDSDGDGFSNGEEARAGTDPHDGTSYPKSNLITVVADDHAFVVFPTIPGIHYQIEASTNLVTWLPYGKPVVGDGAVRTLDIAMRQSFSPGGVSASVWTGLTGYGVALIRNYATNAAIQPHIRRTVSLLEYPQSSPNQEQFGTYITGWLVPPASGSYTFWIASDDSSELWLSTDASPAAKRLVASVDGWTGYREWTKYPSQQSASINLVSNRTYYFEVFHRESFGGDHLSVAWTRPDAAPGSRDIIGGSFVTPSPGSLYDFAQGGNPVSLRLSVQQVDSDNDGLLDYEEEVLGLNPAMTNSTPRQPDRSEALRIIGSENSITIGSTKPRAYESTGASGEFTVYRGGNINPVSVPFMISGSAIPETDFIQPPGTIAFHAGQRLATINIVPVYDGIIETAEVVTITLLPGTNYVLGSPATASVSIDDAPDVLYVAQMRVASGIPGGGGSGVGSVRRAGNALSSRINLSFNGLKSSEISAEIIVSSNGITGTVVETLPMDQVSRHPWNFAATNGMSREAILEALDAGYAWIRIRTAANPSGELIGQLIKSPGWQTMPVPVDPPPAPVSAGTIAEASRFLTQATFGPSSVDLAALTSSTFAAWIDNQQSLPPTYHLPYVQFRRAELYARDGSDGWQTPRQMAWWQHALTAPDQLRQRMAWALSQILVVSQFGALDGEHEGVTRYYDHLIENAFGNYRDLLEDVTLSPMMGIYLSMMRNQKPDPVTGHEPDENYAREIMQLFTIGLTEMHNDGSFRLDAEGMPIPTYTQNDIVGLAHIFTGWSAHYDTTNPPTWSNGSVAHPNDWFVWGWDSMRAMSFYGNRHDTLDRTIVGNVTIPASTNGVDRMRQALDTLFNHPNMGPFIARQLIQRFVTSNPGPGYIHRVASVFNDNGSGVRGDLGATIKAVLLDHDARSPTLLDSVSFGKPVEPVMRMTRMLRAFPPAAPFAANGDHRLFVEFQWSMPEQVPQYASSVFNFYQPGYRQPGLIARSGLSSPEFQIYAETTAMREANLHYSAINWGIWTSEPLTTNSNVTLQMDMSPLVAILQTPALTPAQAQGMLIDHLDALLLFGNMSSTLRGNLESFFASLPSWYNYTESNQSLRARVALYLVLNSPEFLTQR